MALPDPIGGAFGGTWSAGMWVHTVANSSSYTTLAAAYLPINSIDKNPAEVWTFEDQSRLFGSYHPGGCLFTMADGSVQFVSESIDLALYRALGARDDGLPTGGFTP